MACPVHSFVFDLATGRCVAGSKRKPKPATVYKVQITASGHILLSKEPAEVPPVEESEVQVEDGNRMQMHLVEAALEAKFG